MRTNLGLFLEKRPRLSPRLEALVEVERGHRYTYAELDARCNRLADALFHTVVRVVDEAGEDTAPGEVGGGLDPRRAHHGRVLEPARSYLRDHHRGLAALRRPRHHGRRRLRLHPGPQEGRDHLGRREHLPGRGGERAGRPSQAAGERSHRPALGAESPAAIVVPRPGEIVSTEEVIAFCSQKLARYKIPRVVEQIDEIPRNPTEKILKRMLRERFPGPAPE